MDKGLIWIALTAFAVTAVAEALLLPMLCRLKIGQMILRIGPSWHMHKQGTPTMGGIAFLCAAAVIALTLPLTVGIADKALILTLLYAILNGGVGALDDAVKLTRKQNEGLSAASKLVLQLLLSLAYLVALWQIGALSGKIYIPFLAFEADLGALFIPFGVIFLSGFTNAVNLTDGLDGLCSSVTAAVAFTLAALSVRFGQTGGAVISLLVLGVSLAFLIFNHHPAKVFMGDTGSLFLGAAVSAAALIYLGGAVLFAIGAVYLFEAVSVILQVGYYKLTKKRLFLIAPYHHHLERKGRSERWITLTFSTLTLMLGAVCYAFA